MVEPIPAPGHPLGYFLFVCFCCALVCFLLLFCWLIMFGELLPFVSLENLLFHLSVQPEPSLPTIFFEEHLALHKTSSRGEKQLQQQQKNKKRILSQMFVKVKKAM